MLLGVVESVLGVLTPELGVSLPELLSPELVGACFGRIRSGSPSEIETERPFACSCLRLVPCLEEVFEAVLGHGVAGCGGCFAFPPMVLRGAMVATGVEEEVTSGVSVVMFATYPIRVLSRVALGSSLSFRVV
jgi:hypothetical protein